MDIETITFDIKDTWQARALEGANGMMAAVVLSVLAHTYDDAMPVLLETVFPGFRSITAPFLCTAAKVEKSGAVVADVVQADGRVARNMVIFRSEVMMRDAFRALADRLKLTDTDRVEFFKCAQRWVVADRRLDPAMNPKDPDAKRIILH